MKGIVFNLLAEAVGAEHGADAWDDLLDAAGIEGAYTSLGSYPDAELALLVTTASAVLGVSAPQVLRWFGRKAMPMLADRYGIFFDGHNSARSFILSVNDIIHPEVRKLYAGAGCPHFHFHQHDDGRVVVGYHSARQLCHLAHGFMEGAADRFEETVDVEHLACMHNGDPACRLAVRWIA